MKFNYIQMYHYRPHQHQSQQYHEPTLPVTPEPTVEPTPTVTNTPSPTPEQPTGDRAILIVTMTTGLEKEFDLSMTEVNDFITWYGNKQSGTGTASYAIDKHGNNKGPFTNRKDI